jgi:hypothetical protein
MWLGVEQTGGYTESAGGESESWAYRILQVEVTPTSIF